MFLLRYSKPRCGCISLLYAKSRRKKYLNLFVSSKKSRTFASRFLHQKTLERDFKNNIRKGQTIVLSIMVVLLSEIYLRVYLGIGELYFWGNRYL